LIFIYIIRFYILLILLKMNFNKLFGLTTKKLFTDLALTLKDDTSTMTLNVHKSVLYASSPFFEKLLMTQCKEGDANEITIIIPNAQIVYDIIMSFYQQPAPKMTGWKYTLESYRCYDYLGLDFDIMQLYNLTIPSEGFGMLLDLVEELGYDSALIRLILKNIPKDYDLKELPKELLEEILKFAEPMIITGHADGGIKIYNTNGRSLNKICGHTYTLRDICCTPSSTQFISVGTDYTLKIRDLETGHIIKKINIDDISYVSSICCSPDGRHMAIYDGWFIHIIDIQSTRKLNIALDDTNYENLKYSPDGKQLVMSHNKIINVWDATTGFDIWTYVDMYSVDALCYHPSGNIIMLGCHDGNHNSIAILDVTKQKMVKLWKTKQYSIDGRLDSICCSHNDKYLATSNRRSGIDIWNIRSGTSIHTFRFKYQVAYDLHFSMDDEKLFYRTDKNLMRVTIQNGVPYTLRSYSLGDLKHICYTNDYHDLTNQIKKILNKIEK